MAKQKQRPLRTRNGVPLTRDEYRQMNGVNYEYRVIAFYAEDAEA